MIKFLMKISSKLIKDLKNEYDSKAETYAIQSGDIIRYCSKYILALIIVWYRKVQFKKSNMTSISSYRIRQIVAVDAYNSTSSSDADDAFKQLIPAVSQCFIVMLGGYIAGRMKIISPTEAKGLNMFVSYVSLPALIFSSMATLDFTNVNWMFLIAVFLSKGIIFSVVAFITSIVNWPQNFGKAGLYAIFCTMSNDFALGYPIIVALYSKTHPEYASYLYLVAPISLCILNPLGFILLEIDKERKTMYQANINSSEEQNGGRQTNGGKSGIALRVIKGVLRNPVVVMTFLGIIYNFIFGKVLPVILYSVLQVCGSAFSATALFLLGLNMVGKIGTLRNGNNLLLPALLIVIKIIALPLIIKETLSLLKLIPQFQSMSDGIPNITEFGFLYGTFPSAPTVFVFSSAYGTAVDVIASAMVACTFLSAPLMFISAKMINLNVSNPLGYYKELHRITFYLSIVTIICFAWVLIVMYLSKKYRRVPHIFTIILILCQSIAVIGIWVERFSREGIFTSVELYASFLLKSIGTYSARIMATVISISTALLQVQSLCSVLRMRKYAPIVAIGIPTVIFIVYCVIEDLPKISMKGPVEFQFLVSKTLAIIVLIINVLCLVITLSATVIDQRHLHRRRLYQQLLVNDEESLIPEEQRREQLNSIKVSVDSLKSVEIAKPSKLSKNRFYQNRRDEILCENFGICKRKTYKDQLLITGYETKKKDPSKVEDLSFQFSLRGLGLPVGADKYSRSFEAANGHDNQQDVPVSHKRRTMSCNDCDSSPTRSEKSNLKCKKLVKNYEAVVVSAEESHSKHGLIESVDEHEYSPHLVLVIYVCITMLADISTSSCILLLEKPSGIYIELEFLNYLLVYCQGIVVFFLFGIDSKFVLVPLQNMWQKVFKEKEDLKLPPIEDLEEETLHICEQFRTYHINKCIDDIVEDKRWRLRLYKSVFWGKELVSWLVEVGLAHNRADGVKYGQALLNGRIIKQFDEKHHFHDSLYFYVFTLYGTLKNFEQQTESNSINDDNEILPSST